MNRTEEEEEQNTHTHTLHEMNESDLQKFIYRLKLKIKKNDKIKPKNMEKKKT